jgi:hypothetical protein
MRTPQHINRAALLAVAALVAAPALAWSGQTTPPVQGQPRTLGGEAPDTAFVVVHLRETGGACAVLHKTDSVRISRSKKPFVEFVVVNDCTESVWVSVTDFAHVRTPGAADPLETTTAERRRNAGANRVSNILRLRVKADALVGTWSYNLRINDAIVDPKIDIEP